MWSVETRRFAVLACCWGALAASACGSPIRSDDGANDGPARDGAGPDGGGGAGRADGAGGADAVDAAGDESLCGFVMPNPASSGLPNSAAYDTSVPGLVMDQVSGLVWERQVTGHAVASTGCTVNLTGILLCPWRYAIAHCAQSRLGGFSDWRLPNILELLSLIDFTVKEPQLDQTAFPQTPPESFWSSTRGPGAQLDLAHFVSFANGLEGTAFIDEPRRVRCVRTGSTVPPLCAPARSRFRVTGDIASDLLTGLSWQRNPAPHTMNWAGAGSHCAGLGGGFRLPSIKELLTLLDFTKSPTTAAPIDRTVFSGPLSSYWTSSVFLSEYMTAWAVNFQDARQSTAPFSNALLNVRCVR
jgi:hypothetical protein